jgi:hypothetical protein
MKSTMTGNLALSGGAFGPEASLPLFVIGTATGCALLFYAWKKGKFAKPRWNLAPEQSGP